MQAGTMFDGFDDETLIGEGGLGRVYSARRRSTGGMVAIKSLRDVADSSPAWHRANRELEAMLRVKGHPYVVTVEEILQGPEGPCLVMEFLPGGSIADRMGSGALTSPEVVLIGQHVADALLAAHDLGIVHRDIKPANLMIGGFGQVKVGDFGISALARGDEQTKTSSLTLAYASPEELDGEQRVGPATDVYSLAATLHHMLTGIRPTFGSRLHGWAPLEDITDPALAPVVQMIEAGLLDEAAARPTMHECATAFDQAAAALGDRAVKRLAPADSSTQVAGSAAQRSTGGPATVSSGPPSTPTRLAESSEPVVGRGPDEVSETSPHARPAWQIPAAVAVLVIAAVVGGVVVFGGGSDGEPEVGVEATVPVSDAEENQVAENAVQENEVEATDDGEPDGNESGLDAGESGAEQPGDSEDAAQPGEAQDAGPDAEPAEPEEPEIEPLDSVDGVLRVAGLFPASGDMEFVAIAPRLAAELAVADINAAGGVLDADVTLSVIELDTVGVDPFTLVEAVAAGGGEVADVVIGPLSTDGTGTVVAALRESGRLTISPSEGDMAFAGERFARLVGSDRAEGLAISQQIASDGFSTVALVGLGEATTTSVRDGAAGGPVDVVLNEVYDDRIAEVAAQVVARSPDAVLIAGFEDDTAEFLDAVASAGDGTIPFALYGTSSNTGGGLPDLVSDPSLVAGMVGTFVASEFSGDFNARLVEAGLAEGSDSTFGAETYDAVVLAALATRADDSDDPARIVEQLVEASTGGTPCASYADCAAILDADGDIDYQGVSGAVDIGGDLERSDATVLVFRYTADADFAFETAIQPG